MYDRAPRIVSQVKPTTTEIVGPGAYDVPIAADVARRRFGEFAVQMARAKGNHQSIDFSKYIKPF